MGMPFWRSIFCRGLFLERSAVNSFADNVRKLSGNKTKWSGFLTRTRAFILKIFMEYLISGPKRYLDFRETGLKADDVNKNQPAGSHLRPAEGSANSVLNCKQLK